MKSVMMNRPGDQDTFVVHVMRKPGAVPFVTSIELLLADMRNRYTFKTPRNFKSLFTDDLADRLNEVLGRIEGEETVVSLPDFEMAKPGLVLAGLRVLVTRLSDGVEHIMMRFRYYVGAIKSVFKFDETITIESATVREQIAVEVLRDIVTPLFDIVALSDSNLTRMSDNNQDAIRKRLRAISSRQNDLSFYLSLLQRYVAGCESDTNNKLTQAMSEKRKMLAE
ncbi:hypothetical protein [Litoreibacter roseus]|nr:hypothetical protein [Litoreibacter roseus]